MATLFLLCSDAWLCWDREYHQENKWIYNCLYDYKMCCLSIKFTVWRFLKSIWLIILILKMFSESIWLQDEIVQEKWEQPKTRAFGEVLKFSTEKLYISDQIRWKWIKWLMIMQSRLRKFINLLANMIVSMLLLFMMMSKCKHKESLFLKHILIIVHFKLNILGLVLKDRHFHFFLKII